MMSSVDDMRYIADETNETGGRKGDWKGVGARKNQVGRKLYGMRPDGAPSSLQWRFTCKLGREVLGVARDGFPHRKTPRLLPSPAILPPTTADGLCNIPIYRKSGKRWRTSIPSPQSSLACTPSLLWLHRPSHPKSFVGLFMSNLDNSARSVPCLVYR